MSVMMDNDGNLRDRPKPERPIPKADIAVYPNRHQIEPSRRKPMSETFAQAVERLKNNKRALCFLPEIDRDIFNDIGKKNCDVLNANGNWERTYASSGEGFWLGHIYRIRPDYQPETEKPEDIDREVYENCGGNLIVECPDGAARFIDEVVRRPAFRGFFLENGDEVSLGWIARRHAEGKLVVAKFERK